MNVIISYYIPLFFYFPCLGFVSMNKSVFLGTAILAALVISITMTPAMAAISKDPAGDATNGNSDFDIKKFGIDNDGNPYIDVYGKAGGTTVNDGNTILAYVFVTDAGAFAVTSHGGIEDSDEVDDDEEFHGHLVALSSAGCVVGITDDGDAQLNNKRVSITNTGATALNGVLTAQLNVIPAGICVTSVFDTID